MKKKISVIVLSYNEEKNIPVLYKRLTKVLKPYPNYEIVYIDNGSTDGSDKIFKDLSQKDKHFKVVVLSRNFFPDNAIFSGLEYCTGDAAVVMEGDLQDPPEIIPQFIKKWQEGYDIVYGVRETRVEARLMIFLRKLFYRLMKKMAYIDFPVDAGSFSLVDRKIVDILNKLPEKDNFFRGLRAWVGFKQVGVSYHRKERLFGKSTNSFLDLINWSKKGILSFSYAPLQFASYIAFLAIIISVIAFLIYLSLYFIIPSAPRGIPTVILLIIIYGGLNLFVLSVIGEYLARIFEEIKQRPKYIVSEFLNSEKNNKRD